MRACRWCRRSRSSSAVAGRTPLHPGRGGTGRRGRFNGAPGAAALSRGAAGGAGRRPEARRDRPRRFRGPRTAKPHLVHPGHPAHHLPPLRGCRFDAVRRCAALRRSHQTASGVVRCRRVGSIRRGAGYAHRPGPVRDHELPARPDGDEDEREAGAVYRQLCHGCHVAAAPGAENPAEPLDRMARTLPRDEFLARMLLGIRGTPEIGLANPLTPFEIGAMTRFLLSGRTPEAIHGR